MLLASIERLLNRSLPRSPRAQALAATLAGRTLVVEVTGAGPVVLSLALALIEFAEESRSPIS